MTILTVRGNKGRVTASTRFAAVVVLVHHHHHMIHIIEWESEHFSPFPSYPKHNIKKEFVRELVFDVCILGCLQTTWVYFPLHVSVLRGC